MDAADSDRRELTITLLTDDPSDTDVLDAHDRVAQAVCETITSQPGGKALALIGTYGSGKSTVVELIRKRLAEGADATAPTDVFVFDAWRHQGDPLRRAFLLQLRHFLSSLPHGGRFRKKLTQYVKPIRDHEVVTERKSTPNFTPLGRLAVLLTLLAPLGYVVLAKSITLDSNSDLKWLWPWPWGLLMAVSPLLLALICQVLWCFPCWRRNCLARWLTGDEEQAKGDVFPALLHKTTEATTTTEYRSPDPTSIEFRCVFLRMIRRLYATPRRQLLIVIDNLDRMAIKEAEEVWSTMRVFFDRDDPRLADLQAKVWLLVPFSVPFANRLWGSDYEQAHSVENENEQGTGSADLEAEDKRIPGSSLTGRARSFVDKTFQATFHVPPPVLVSWRDFMSAKLAEALYEITEGESRAVYRLYSLLGLKPGSSPTPRDIVQFVNALAVSCRRWQRVIPIPVQAAYVLKAKDIASPREDLTNQDFLPEQVRDALPSQQWQEYFAAMHFGVEVDRAIDVLLIETVREALEAGNAEELAKWCKRARGMEERCDEVVLGSWRVWTESTPELLALAARAIGFTEEELECQFKGGTWQWISLGIDKAKELKSVNDEKGDGLAAILGRSSERDYPARAKHILTLLGQTSTKENEEYANSAVEWIDCVGPVLQVVAEREEMDDVLGDLAVPYDAAYYLDVLAMAIEGAIPEHAMAYLKPSDGWPGIDEQLRALIVDGQFTERIAAFLPHMASAGAEQPSDTLVNELLARYQSGKELSADEISGILRVLLPRASAGPKSALLKTIKAQGFRRLNLHCFHGAKRKGHNRAAAYCVLAELTAQVEAAPPEHGNAAEGFSQFKQLAEDPQTSPGVVTEIARIVCHTSILLWLLGLATSEPGTQKLVSAVVRAVGAEEVLARSITAQIVLDHADLVFDALEEGDRNRLLEKLKRDERLLDHLEDRGFDPEHARVYYCVLPDEANDLHTSFVSFLIKGLRSMATRAWVTELGSPGFFLKAVLRLQKIGSELNLTVPYQDALEEHGSDVMDGGELAPELAAMGSMLVSALRRDYRGRFTDTLAEGLIAHRSQDLTGIISLYGEVLAQSDSVSSMDESIVDRVFDAMLNRNAAGELGWILRVVQVHRSLVSNCSEDARTRLAERIVNSYGRLDSDDERRETIRQIAEAVSVELPKPEERQPEDAESESEDGDGDSAD